MADGLMCDLYINLFPAILLRQERMQRPFLPLAGESWREGFFRTWFLLSIALFSNAAAAEELPDPTRPPAFIAAPAASVGAEVAHAGLQSIIISPIRRAAIIDGETVELDGKHGDARLIEVNEGSVVLTGAQGRQVLTLFPDVKWVSKKELEIKPQPAANKVRTGKQKARPVAQREGK